MPRRLQEYTGQARLNRGDAGAMSLPMASSSIESLAGLGSDIAKAGMEIARQRDTSRMLKELSDLQIGMQERINQLAQHGSGDKPLVDSALEDFREQANSFINAQPAYLREYAHNKMVQMRDQVATKAIGLASALAAQDMAREAQEKNNNLTNMVMMGDMEEGDALAQMQEYLEALPENLRAPLREKMSESIRSASLSELISRDPNAGIRAVHSGRYNDMSPSILQSHLDRAQRQIESAQSNFLKMQNEIARARISGDTARAGQLFAQMNGLNWETMSSDEKISLQVDRMDVPLEFASLLTKDEAKEIAFSKGDQLKTVNGVATFLGEMDAKFPNPDHSRIVVKDLVRYSDMPDTVKHFMAEKSLGIIGDNTEFYAHAFQVMGNESHVIRLFNARQENDSKIKDNFGSFQNSFHNKVVTAMTSAGVNPEDANRVMAMHENVYRHLRNSGMKHDEASRIAMGRFHGDKVSTVSQGNVNVMFPKDIAGMFEKRTQGRPYTNPLRETPVATYGKTGGKALNDFILSPEIDKRSLIVPHALENNPDLFYETVLDRAVWINGTGTHNGSVFYSLMYESKGGVLIPLFKNNGSPLRISEDNMRILLQDLTAPKR